MFLCIMNYGEEFVSFFEEPKILCEKDKEYRGYISRYGEKNEPLRIQILANGTIYGFNPDELKLYFKELPDKRMFIPLCTKD